MNQDKSAHFSDTIFDAINEGVFSIDFNKRILSFNESAERITKVPRSKAIGMHCYDVFQGNLCQKKCSMDHILKTGMPQINRLAKIVTAAGDTLPICFSAALLKDAHGRPVGIVDTIQDLNTEKSSCDTPQPQSSFEGMVGCSPDMKQLFHILPRVSQSESTVLIQGPSGTGKELLARIIHNLSPRCNGGFVAINCAAFPDALLEAELFGYHAGAFTGAVKDKPGRFTAADGGTIFLDEIGDMSPAMQVRLLRVLQERVVEPLGSLAQVPIDTRVVAATNKDLPALVRQGLFRQDLFFRIRVVELTLPPLAKRREDISPLVQHMINRFNKKQERRIKGFSDQAWVHILTHSYPGNIRELENIIEQAFVLCSGDLIDVCHLPPELRPSCAQDCGQGTLNLKKIEKLLIIKALQRYDGNRRLASQCLGIDPSTLYRKMRSMDISLPGRDGRYRH